MGSIVTGLVAIFILTSSLPTAVQAGYPTVMRSVRAVQGPREGMIQNMCTATSINQEKQLWLTAAHCVDELGVTPRYIMGHMTTTVFKDDAADLAVLQTKDYPVPALKLRSTRPAIEQAIRMVGHPLGLVDVQVFNGRISSLRSQVDQSAYMLFDMTACGGNSGSTVVDSNDDVVSVLQIGFGPGCSPFTGGAPWDVLARLVGKFFRS
jgi:S1-C subfamily serine protease